MFNTGILSSLLTLHSALYCPYSVLTPTPYRPAPLLMQSGEVASLTSQLDEMSDSLSKINSR